MSNARRLTNLACFLTVSLLASCGDAAPPVCPAGAAIETDGHRRLALIVGVGDYEAARIPDLTGPANDARRIYDVLTADDGYGFPKENVCMLLDGQATTAAVKQAFDDALVARAQKGDLAVFFYAGHGSQTRDDNADEPDLQDETLVLHDARTKKKGKRIYDLVDDEFNGMLARLHQKTDRIVVVLDSCNSGTATRNASSLEAGAGAVARFIEPDEPPDAPTIGTRESADGGGDGAAGWAPEVMPGLVVLTAAIDGTAALEKDGRGIFTDALVAALLRGRDRPLTYAQLAREVQPLVRAESYQITDFQGDLSQWAFDSSREKRPLAWDVAAVGPPIELAGPPLPGFATGAELRVYDATATTADTQKPDMAKALLVVTQGRAERGPGKATAKVVSTNERAGPIENGDLAVLARPAVPPLRVRIRPPNERGGVPAPRAAPLREAIVEIAEADGLVELNPSGEDFELSVADDGHLILRGPEYRIRNWFETDADAALALTLHARQRALLQLSGEVGADFVDDETLQVELVPVVRESRCARGPWVQAPPNTEQVIPLCHAWRIKVTLAEDSPVPLIVGGALLSTTGAIIGLPLDGRTELLRAGESMVFGEMFRGLPPIDTQDYVMIVGVQQGNQVPWHLLTAAPRDLVAESGLHRTIQRYVNGKDIGRRDTDTAQATTWTRTLLPVRVEPRTRFLASRSVSGPISTREYTVDVDIRAYLPDDPDSALHKSLKVADWLTKVSGDDGYGYAQHDWSKPTDEQNLSVGIDCSRAVWFAFTRAGLAYNKRSDAYLPTASMVTENTPMQDYFDQCATDGKFQLGDLLVFRSEQKGDGHVVMVIDPDRRIAWGSHGWDGSPRLSEIPGKPDIGVEYQKIKVKKDWQRWDRTDMNLSKCWRYRDFAESVVPADATGMDLLMKNPCDSC